MTEKRIRKAFEHVAPDHLNDVMEQCNAQKQQQKGKILSMTNKTPAPKRSRLPRILAAAAALVLLLTGTAVYGLNTRVCATVALGVNPSIELNVNRRERVVSVSPINNDGKQILGDMDLTGSDLQVAVNALVGSMLRQGYLSELSNSILISVDSSDPSESAALQERLTQEVAALLDTNSFSGAVLSQTVTTDAELSSLAEQYGLTPGKAQLIRRITESHPQHTFEDLAGLSVNELNLLLSSAPNAAESSTSSAVSSTGRASDRAYIGSEQALSIALTAAGLTESEIVHPEIEMDYEHGRMIYDVEFKAGGREYDCEIDALTGDVVWECQSAIKGKYASKDAKAGSYAGVMASPLVGEGEINDLIIFNVNHVELDDKSICAVVYALDKTTGEEVWNQPLDVDSKSSPIGLYQRDGKSYIVMGDDGGTLRLMDGFSGTTLSTLNLGSAIQASPAAYGNEIVVGTTGGMLYFVELK